MTAFFIAAAALAVGGLAWLLWPLLRAEAGAGSSQSATTLAILKAQLAELDAERAAGRLDEAIHAQATAELQRRVLEEASGAEHAAQASHWRGRATAGVIAGVVPLAAALLYLRLGTPEALDPAALMAPAAQAPMTREQIEGLVAQLAARMEKEPGNAEGWALLARSYYAMERFGDAARAYERLLALTPDSAEAMADLADALAMSAGRKIAGRPLELVQAALKRDPTQWKALAMAGTEAFERKDYRAAVDYWERLRAAVPADAPLAQNIAASIDEARKAAGMPPAPTVAAAPPGAAIEGEVRLDPALAGRVAPTDTVFITARATEGPPAPLAVLRLQVKDLPARFRLDDSLAMAPTLRLSAFPEAVVGARVSKSGQAAVQSGDLESARLTVKRGATGLILVIDRALP